MRTDALRQGDKEFQTEIDGKPWVQPTFPYQAKCLQWINQEYQKLGSNGQGQVDEVLDGSNCESLILK